MRLGWKPTWVIEVQDLRLGDGQGRAVLVVEASP